MDSPSFKGKKVYTYFSEKNEGASYLNLCLKTWQRYLPDTYKIEIIKDNDIFTYIPKGLLPGSIESMCSSPLFFNLLSAFVLYEKGGFFLKPDIIMTDKFIPCELLLEKTDLVLYNKGSKNDICLNFMMANKGSSVLGKYIEKIYTDKQLNTTCFLDVLKKAPYGSFFSICAESTAFLMELALFGVYSEYIYRKYYFTNICCVEEFLETTKGISALNSYWTPEKYKNMDENEFLNQDILLANVFKRVLYI